ncbi:proteasome subunit beta type-7-like [Varroa jacobsoni]|uniref:Proteasome subunit beta n=1 Tax=Varroa destructor TaxID=109461 RepID=A0A7M7M2Y8_VARDE|nr:proteasome subunit beta type-7-like [Varroa destructor]XP_022700035.1 proteasome subunit beta type-7-like [Varroa jacobsoni]
MASVLAPELPPRGFSFENCKRNEFLAAKGTSIPKAMKTGTTIVGVVYKDGVILGSDTRATSGNIVATKNCKKLHYMHKKIYCAGAGTAADCSMVNKMISSQLALHALNTGREPRVCTLVRILKQYLFRYQGHVGCALIIGGVDSTGPHLHSISPHGFTMELPYLTMGSGCLNAITVLELGWQPDMELEAAKKLCRDALASGIMNDLASGSNADLVVITQAGAQILRPYEVIQEKGEHAGIYSYAKGTTRVIETKVIPFDIESNVVRTTSEAEPMDI